MDVRTDRPYSKKSFALKKNVRLYENEYNKYDFSNKDRIKYLVLLAFIFYVLTLHRNIRLGLIFNLIYKA